MNRCHERGAGALMMVMLLAAMGLLLLTAMQRQLDMALHVTNDQRLYLLAFNRAESSMNWGLGQTWTLDEGNSAQCRLFSADSLRVCLMRVPGETYWLMRAEGSVAAWVSTLALYRRVLPAYPEQATSRFLPIERGWLDFCPERREADCARN